MFHRIEDHGSFLSTPFSLHLSLQKSVDYTFIDLGKIKYILIRESFYVRWDEKRNELNRKWKILRKSIALTKNHENVKKIENETKLMSLLGLLYVGPQCRAYTLSMSEWVTTSTNVPTISISHSVLPYSSASMSDYFRLLLQMCCCCYLCLCVLFFIHFEHSAKRKKNHSFDRFVSI